MYENINKICSYNIYVRIILIIFLLIFNLLNEKKMSQKKPLIKSIEIINQIKATIFTKRDLQLQKISKTNEIFESNILYLKDTYLTKEYINEIKKYHDKYEEKLNTIKNIDHNIQKNACIKINSLKFYSLCNANKLIKPIYTKYNKYPLISVILPSYNKQKELLKSVRSIQNQSFKNIEIIIVDDGSKDESIKIYNHLLETDKRIRIFYHLKNMGVWRSRLDGLLYSRGKYIIHFDTGDCYADNFILEDSYYLVSKYNLDSVRFSFKYVRDINNIKTDYKIFKFNKNFTKIILGNIKYNVNNYIHGPIWNRLIKKNILLRALNLIDSHILNAYKNLWEDRWWNELTNLISYRNLMFNRIGYLYLKTNSGEGRYKLNNEIQIDKTIQEVIYFWLFSYQILPKNDNKKSIINKIRQFTKKHSKSKINLAFLKVKFETFIHLLKLILNDSSVCKEDKLFIKILLNKVI